MQALAGHIRTSAKSFVQLSCGQLFLVVLSVSFVIFGNVGQLISLNLWIPTLGEGGPFTVLTMSATTNAMFYGIWLLGYYIYKRQPITFLFNAKSLLLVLTIGFCNAFNGVLLVFATPTTPEVVQAFLLSSQILWVFFFVKIIFSESRSYITPLVGIAFLFSLGGITLGLASTFGQKLHGSGKTHALWSLIFAASMIPGALYNVVAAKFLRRYTKPSLPPPEEPVGEETLLGKVNYEECRKEGDPAVHDGLNVKIVMLFATGVAQAMWLFCLLPVDAIPWFGGHPDDFPAIGKSLRGGWRCVLTNEYPTCHNAFKYYVAFNLSYMLSYVGSAWLNIYSPALTSMVTQLSSPVAAIVLIAFPVLNAKKTPYNIGESIGAVFFLAIGTLLYSAWEQSTKLQARAARRDSETEPEPI